jgi:hypothetical protein
MSTSSNEGWLTLEVLYFAAGLRSIVLSENPGSAHASSGARPAGLPEIERIGLDNDVELKPGDWVVDFSRFEMLQRDSIARGVCWLGIYTHAVDTVGDRGNFLGIGVWFRADQALRYQLIIDSLTGTLEELRRKHLPDLLNRDAGLIRKLQGFREELSRTFRIGHLASQLSPIQAASNLSSRVYVALSNEPASFIQLSGAISVLSLESKKEAASRFGRILFLIGPELPRSPRRNWILCEDISKVTGAYSAIDSLLESVVNGQHELRQELARVEEENRQIKDSLQNASLREADCQKKLQESEHNLASLHGEFEREHERVRELEARTSTFPFGDFASESRSIDPPGSDTRSRNLGLAAGFSGTHSASKASSPSEVGTNHDFAAVRRIQEKSFAETRGLVGQLSGAIDDISDKTDKARQLTFANLILSAICFVLLLGVLYLETRSSPVLDRVKPNSSPSPVLNPSSPAPRTNAGENGVTPKAPSSSSNDSAIEESQSQE